MQWFFGYSGNAAGWFKDMIKVAVLSAKKNTSLEPNCLYDGRGDDVVEWLLENGVKVHRTSVPFRDELFSKEVLSANEGTPYHPENASGHFLRLLVPDFSNAERSLYTDCDIMFLREPADKVVETIGACGEINISGHPAGNSFNSGVMIVDNERLRAQREGFIEFARSEGFYSRRHHSYDQVLLNIYFRDHWEPLAPKMNWRPWQGVNNSAQIVHFHGPKPQRIAAILQGESLAGESGLLRYVEADRASYELYCGLFADFLSCGGEKELSSSIRGSAPERVSRTPAKLGGSVKRWCRRLMSNMTKG